MDDQDRQILALLIEDGRRTYSDMAGIVGLRRGTDFQPQPPAETKLLPGDTIVAMGTPRTLERLEKLMESDGAP